MSTLRVPIGENDHILGDPHAAVTLVEYGDYECPFCAAAQPSVTLVLARFRGRLAFVFRHFPLTEIHRNAEVAAETAEFAGANGRFWQMHEAIYANSHRLSPERLLAIASTMGLSEAALQDALVARTYAAKVKDDFVVGIRSGVSGTPTFFINGRRHEGGYEARELLAAIQSAPHAPAGHV